MNRSFGPWTTAMDSGSGARLSTFWKRRIAMLPIVRSSGASVSRRGRILLATAAVLALAMPTLYLSRSVTAEEAEKKPAPAEAGKPFRFNLPGGVIAEIIGVGHNPSQGQPWWAPDGKAIQAPYDSSKGTMSGGFMDMSREIALRWVKKPNDVTVSWLPKFSSSSGGCSAFDTNGKAVTDIQVMGGTFWKTQKTCDIQFGIAAGPWKTFSEDDGRDITALATWAHGYTFSEAIESNGATRITIAHDVLDKDVRIVAVDQKGREVSTKNCGGVGAKGFSQLTAIFPNLPLDQIKSFRLQARDWQNVTVTGIALNPGEKTQPAVQDAASLAKKLPGKWKIVDAEFTGRKEPGMVGIVDEIRDNKWLRPKRRTAEYRLKFDPKNPTWVDLGAERLGDKTLKGIYSLDGDKLTICYSYDPELPRPTEFKTTPDTRRYIYVLERVKE